ncbi:ribonuclease P protein subunit p40-like [Osmia bicornis bicornis]|uniref:ribonuclease P protein subunit p40-like n=1 Tax=Osmia bicornis bicornis TaxID=1437191 RepID=UPI001EAF8438|nr:ribonuclease P protein subunit p40-like [Osmia bicornis bicornis]XP_046142250.1 ribonuclease P protein subunit p40-like [Osmia bicornis bicornis]
MLSPEVWNFKSPQHHNFIETKDHKKANIPDAVTSHYFNHSVSLVLPDTIRIPDKLRTCLSEDTDYYRINGLNVYELINKEFIEAFVKKGELTLLTIGNKIDLDNIIAVTPTGHLILSLLTEDFQKLGLEGTVSFFDRKVHTRYVITIDLKCESFIPGKKNYEHTRISLKERFNQKFDVIVSWNPPDENLCPSSIAAWFHKREYNVSLCHQSFLQKTEYSLKVPIISNDSNNDKFFEWLGVFTISGDLKNNKEDDYVNTYICPSPSTEFGQVQYLQWTGFFTRRQIINLYNAVKEYVSMHRTLPWCALHVQGFQDSPISWDLKEHTFYTDGDNSYTVVFRPAAHTIVRKSLSSNNKPRIFQ